MDYSKLLIFNGEFFEFVVAFFILHKEVELELPVTEAFCQTFALEQMISVRLQTMGNRVVQTERSSF